MVKADLCTVSGFSLGNEFIGEGRKTYFIAEIGSNFDGSLERAKSLIRLAKESGANAAKFQHYTAASLVHPSKLEGNKGKHQENWKGSVYKTYERASLDIGWTEALVDECKNVGIEFMTSPYSVDFISELDNVLNSYKIGSGDITNMPLLERISNTKKPVLLGTGASNIRDVEKAVEIISEQCPLCIMQCNTNYESDEKDFVYQNLRVISTFKERWPDLLTGLSCHLKTHVSVLGAVSLGASVIEKHFTDDCSRSGPDHAFAMQPNEFKQMVEATRQLEKMLGGWEKRVEPNEMRNVYVQRRSIYAKRSLREGEILRRCDIDALRPYSGEGISPMEMDKIIGKTLQCDIMIGELIKKENVL